MSNGSGDGGRHRSRGLLERSGLVTALILAAILAVLGLVWAAHMRGRIHKLTAAEPAAEAPPPPRPGGQEIIHLDRLEHLGATTPEFTSAIILPGLGAELLGATLQLPGQAERPFLAGTAEDELAKIQRPVASIFSVLVQSREGGRWTQPVEAVRGIAAADAKQNVLPDGSSSTSQFAGSPTVAAPVKDVDVRVSTVLTGRNIEVGVTAKNLGDAPKAITITWEPRFLVPAAGLSAMTLLPPQTQAPGTEAWAREADPPPIRLSDEGLNRTYSPLKHSFLSNGPQVQLHNLAENYTLKMTALTPSIHSLHVNAGKETGMVIAFSTAGTGSGDDARTVVEPGQTLQWRVRLEAAMDPGYTPPAE